MLANALNGHADKLNACELITPDGNWSSYPPHKHDEATGCEVVNEEIYYFRVGRTGSTAPAYLGRARRNSLTRRENSERRFVTSPSATATAHRGISPVIERTRTGQMLPSEGRRTWS